MRHSSSIVWCVLTTLAIGSVTDAVLIIRPGGTNFIKAIGTSMMFTCEDTSSSPGSRLLWKDTRDRTVPENSQHRIYVEREGMGVKLYVTRIASGDRGDYKCHRMVGGSSRERKVVTLVVFKDITFDNAPSPQNPPIYRDALIQCRVSSEPPPEVSWRLNGTRIEQNARYSTNSNGLTIRNITRADDGLYTCRAEVKSEGRYDERRITVAVHIPPTISVKLRSTEGVQGSNLNLSCHGRGLPKPKYEFYKNQRRWIVQDSGRVKIDTDNGRVEFTPLHKSDEGVYTCVAINDVGSDNTSANVRVLVPAHIFELNNISSDENSPATLVCRSRGDPAPDMKFRKMGSPHDFNTTNDRGHIKLRRTTGRLDLQFKSLRPSDTGNYSCTSENKAGSHSRVGSIVVNYKPRFARDHDRQVFIWPGTTHNITCHVHAYPVPTIEWWRKGRKLANNLTYSVFVHHTHSNLQMVVKESDRWIYGQYSCRAINRLGEARINIDIAQATIPGKPTVRVKETSPNMVILEVEPPRNHGGKEVIGYRVVFDRKMTDYAVGYKLSRAEVASRGHPATRRPELQKDELVIENLSPDKQYLFYVQAKNDVGVGPRQDIRARTTAIRKPYPIQVISPRQGDDAYSYTMEWANPKTGGNPIEKYYIRFRQVDTRKKSAVEPWRPMVEISDDRHRPISSYRFDGLKPRAYYEVEMSVENHLGKSERTRFVFITSEVNPGAEPVRQPTLGLWTMIAIAVGVILVIAVVIDVSCYFMSGCGVTMCICVRLCDREPPDADDTAELKETNRNNDVEVAPAQPQQPVSQAPAAVHDDRPPAGKDSAATAKLTKEQELEKKVLEPREKEHLIRAQHDAGRPQKEEKQNGLKFSPRIEVSLQYTIL